MMEEGQNRVKDKLPRQLPETGRGKGKVRPEQPLPGEPEYSASFLNRSARFRTQTLKFGVCPSGQNRGARKAFGTPLRDSNPESGLNLLLTDNQRAE